MLKEKQALTSLGAQLEKRKGRECWSCRKFRHLACNCRNKNEKKKGRPNPHNKFEVLASESVQILK